MPRQPNLDTSRALHHIVKRGIDGIEIYSGGEDCMDFLARLKSLCESKVIGVYAWS